MKRHQAPAVRRTSRRREDGGCSPLTEACDFREWESGAVRPDCCTTHLIELACFTRDLLTRHGITYWLDGGSLLGAVRNGELIPWDADLDFGILAEDAEKVSALVPEIEASGHAFKSFLDLGILQIRVSSTNTLHADLLPWRERDGVLDAWYDPKWDWPGMSIKRAFPQRFIESFEDVRLHGEVFKAPAPAVDFLRDYRYGPDYMTPKRPSLRSEDVGAMRLFKLDGEIDDEKWTSTSRAILERIILADRDLYDMLGSPSLSGRRVGLLWKMSGLPLGPDAKRVESLRVSLASDSNSPTTDRLLDALAMLDQAVDEIEQPPRGMRLRRAHRRLRRGREGLAAGLRRRPHHAGFPFGPPGA